MMPERSTELAVQAVSASPSPAVALPRGRSIALPIEARIIILAICFRLLGATVGFIANVTIPDFQDQGFTVMERPNPFWDRFARWTPATITASR